MEEQAIYEIPEYNDETPEDFLKTIVRKEIVKSWDVECGCPVSSLKEEIQKIQQKFGLKADEGYITTFTNDHETVFMVFSETWISQEEARQFVEGVRKSAIL